MKQNKKLQLRVELKLLKTMDKHTHNQLIISSFNYFILFQIKYFIKAKIKTAIILKNQDLRTKLKTRKTKFLIKLLKPQFIHPEHKSLNRIFIEWAHKNEIKINTYTVNHKHDINRCINIGVDGIITDNHSIYSNEQD